MTLCDNVQDESAVLLVADPCQQSLEREVNLDPMDGEQTWPTEEELAAAEGAIPLYCHMTYHITCPYRDGSR